MQAVLGESAADFFDASPSDAASEPIATEAPASPATDDFTSRGEPPVETPEPETSSADEKPPAESDRDADRERNPDGTFKAKAATPAADVKAAKKPRDDPHARVEQATAKEATAKRERDEARAEAARLRVELDAVRAPRQEPARQPAASVAEDAEPNPDDATKYPDGQFDRKFLKDQARWEATQEINRREAAATERDVHERRSQRVLEAETKFRERIGKAEGLHERLTPEMHAFLGAAIPASVLPKGQPVAFVNVMGEAFLHAEHPDRLLQHFSDQPDDLQRFSTLHPADFYRHLGILEAHLDAASPSGPAPPATTISQAKPLIQPVSSGPSASEDDPNAIEDFAAFVRENNKRDPRFRRRA